MLRRKACRSACAQQESGYLGLESRRVRADKIVVSFHEAFTRLEYAEALVFVNLTGRNYRLFSDYSFALHFGVLAYRVVYQPAPRNQLGRLLSDILDPHEIREHVVSCGRL